MGWFALKFLGLPRYLWLVLAAAAVIGLWLWVGAAENADDKQNREIGAVVERAETTTEVLERTEQGNEARTDIEIDLARGATSQRVYDQCVRSNRGAPEVCERFLPQRPTADD